MTISQTISLALLLGAGALWIWLLRQPKRTLTPADWAQINDRWKSARAA